MLVDRLVLYRFNRVCKQKKESGSDGFVYLNSSVSTSLTSNSVEDDECLIPRDNGLSEINQTSWIPSKELPFQCVEGRSYIARSGLLLCNVSDCPLIYKFKTDAGDFLTVSLPIIT